MQARKSGISKRGRTLAALVWAASVLAGLVQFAPASAATEATDPAQTVALAVSRTEAKQAARFWTRENRLTATEYVATMPTVDDEGSVRSPAGPGGSARHRIGHRRAGGLVTSCRRCSQGTTSFGRARRPGADDGGELDRDTARAASDLLQLRVERRHEPGCPRWRWAGCSSKFPASRRRGSTSAPRPWLRAKARTCSSRPVTASTPRTAPIETSRTLTASTTT